MIIKLAIVLLICNLGCYLLIPQETQDAMNLFGNHATELPDDMQCIVEPQYGDDCRLIDISSYEFDECQSRRNETVICAGAKKPHCPHDECYIYMKIRNRLALSLSRLEMRFITSLAVLYLVWTVLSPYWFQCWNRRQLSRVKSPIRGSRSPRRRRRSEQ